MLSFLSGDSVSQTTQSVDSVMLYITVISLILLFGITIVMIYFVFKYNRKKGHKPVDIHGNIYLEILWILIPGILVLTMFFYGYQGYSKFRKIPKDALVIHVSARMWNWEFTYSNGYKDDTLYVPVNKAIKLELNSMDVNHSFYIPAFRIKEDVIASKTNYLSFKPEKIGSYDIACAEYCGLNHSAMYTKLIVLSKVDFEQKIKK
ncbi:MAG: cytochrome c oxidase subunit II [bacterium]